MKPSEQLKLWAASLRDQYADCVADGLIDSSPTEGEHYRHEWLAWAAMLDIVAAGLPSSMAAIEPEAD